MLRHFAAAFLSLLSFHPCAGVASAQGTPIGFAERWALAADRAKVLDELIPGTADFYYYHCLHHQDTGAFDKVEPTLKVWVQRHGRTRRVIEIENRQALLTFEKDPAATLAHLKRRLGLRFDHARQIAGAKRDLPTALDPSLVSRAAFVKRALQRHPRTAQGLRETAFESLLASGINDDLLMDVLGRLRRPDVANLPTLIVRNLRHRRSRGFGSMPIHRALLLDQLDECARLRPALLADDRFIAVYVRRLRPNADVDWQRDPEARRRYLERLQAFADRLSPAHGSFQAHVLHHRLRHDLAIGQPDKQRLMAYLRLPRPASYVNPAYLSRFRGRRLVDARRRYDTGLAPIGDDTALVRAYLMHFFVDEGSYEGYAEILRATFLKRLFAETKILHGVGDMERWYSLLDDPAYYEKLKERVEIDFAATQPRYYAAADAVTLDVDVKNVRKLLVKIFEIHAFNYYRSEQREIDASIGLDGLVANDEFTREYAENPLRRVRRRFELPQLSKPGVYVVELIGNGISSRAVIHKGRLQLTEQLGAAGHVFTVRGEDGRTRSDAEIWFGGRTYAADQDGEIVVPYSTKPGKRSIVVRGGGIAALEQFQHRGETYALHAGVHVDRESLLARSKARILIRPDLRLNGRVIPLQVLENPVLSIRAVDRDGIQSVLTVRDLKLDGQREIVREVQVPRRMAQLRVALEGRVKSLTQGKSLTLRSPERYFEANQIDATPMTGCALLGRSANGYTLDVLGKNGEPKVGRVVRVSLIHRDCKDAFAVALKTDARGRIELGKLDGIARIQASGFPKNVGLWELRSSARSYPSELHGVAGETLRLPFAGGQRVSTRAVVSLLEVRQGAFVRDAFDQLAIADGFLELRKLAPGDYSLWLKQVDQEIAVRVTDGARRDGWVVGRSRMLERTSSGGLHVRRVDDDGKELRIELANASPEARVHVVATRYHVPYDPFAGLRLPAGDSAGVKATTLLDSTYQSGREIGDEYRYILDRRFAKKFPGNMLARPGLILNPWQIDEDAMSTAIGLGGGAGGRFSGRGRGRRGLGRRGGRRSQGRVGPSPGTFPSLEFLQRPSTLVANLRPGEGGVVRVSLDKLGDGQLVHVIAVDARDTVYATHARAEVPLAAADRTLPDPLQGGRHYAERRTIEFVAKGARATMRDAATARAKTYDTLADIHGLFTALTGNESLAEFAFVLRWPELSDEEKQKAYDRHGCHELHFFLYEKDRAFFDRVVRPYLANKAHKTFLDDWLLGRDLDGYLEPWRFGRLNIVERILLARRLSGQEASIRRHVQERFDLAPRDPAALARIFDAALKSGALDADGSLEKKLNDVRKNALRQRFKKTPRRSARARPGEGKDKAGKVAADNAADEELEERAASPEPAEKPSGLGAPPAAGGRTRMGRELQRRKSTRELYRAPDPTNPYAESNYWHRRIREHDAKLVQVNAFWRDFATAPTDAPFVSQHVAEATRNFTEMMFALSVLDLPFVAGKHTSTVDGAQLSIEAASHLLLVRKELVEATQPAAGAPTILVSQNYYRLDEPYRFEGNERFDAYITGEFLVDVAYGCRVVVTNPSSTPRKLDLLLQIPAGAIPVKGGFYTKGVRVSLGAYATSSIEYAFYFPSAGERSHYPVHVAQDGKLVAFASGKDLSVVPVATDVDTTSWQYVSQNASDDALVSYLEGANLQRLDMSKIAWRMRDRAVFGRVVDLLRRRHAYSDAIWAYGVHHGDAATVREFLRHREDFLRQCGPALASPLVEIDAIERRSYEHIEYEPLFNARAHRFGKRREILNLHFGKQYTRLLQVLGHRPKLDDVDWMSVTYYMLLQDRTEEALAAFGRVDPSRLPMRIQYDYMRAYLDFYTPGTAVARDVAQRYASYPVVRWQKRFSEVRNQLAEIAGEDIARGDAEDRTQRQTTLAAKAPSLQLGVEARRVTVRYENVESCRVRYYAMDVEFLFSTHPFVQQGSGSFAYIRPNAQETRSLPRDKREIGFDLPRQFRNSNVLIEVEAGGVTKRKAYYANSLDVKWKESYGQLHVADATSGKALPTVYVKVFARDANGGVRFYKDGYTDLRGRFDYASLSGDRRPRPRRFSILVLSDKHGAVIRELAPPTE